MAASALFYGVRQKGIGDITSSMIISLVSTLPVFVCRTLFRKSRPKAVAAKRELPVDNVPEWKLETSLAVIETSKTYLSAMDSIAHSDKKTATLEQVDAAFAKIAASKSVFHQQPAQATVPVPAPVQAVGVAGGDGVVRSHDCSFACVWIQFDLTYEETALPTA